MASRRYLQSGGASCAHLNWQRQHRIHMFRRNPIALQPALDGRMISMAQLARHRTNPTTLTNDFSIASHEGNVRNQRTYVNVENVRNFPLVSVMSGKPTIGEQLRALQERAGLSYDAIAKRAGYNGRSSVQRYFSPEYAPDYLPLTIAEKLAVGFSGTNVSRSDIMSLAGMPENNGQVFKYEGASLVALPRDVPVFGTALGAPRDFDGEAIEQTMLNSGETIGYLPRPSVLNGVEAAYGLYVQGSSMAPRFDNGETIFVTDSTRSRPPKIGDDVVVYLHNGIDDDNTRVSAVLIKRLVRRTALYVELEQFNPALTFKVDASRVVKIDRVIPWSELLS